MTQLREMLTTATYPATSPMMSEAVMLAMKIGSGRPPGRLGDGDHQSFAPQGPQPATDHHRDHFVPLHHAPPRASPRRWPSQANARPAITDPIQ